MRKGLVVTLGVVALFFAASQSYSLAPVISAIPDIIISDAEQNTATEDRNFFIFSNALDLDELVRDDDTTASLLKWSFVESSPGNSIAINGIGSYAGPDYRDPGAFNLRAVSRNATFQNKLWSPLAGSPPFPDPGVASMDSMIQMAVSDGTKVSSQTVTVTTVNTTTSLSTNRDRVVPQRLKTWTFTAGAEGWTYLTNTGAGISAPSPGQSSAGGALSVEETPHGTPIVYGSWESPRSPTDGIALRWGTVMRARYEVVSTVGDKPCPGFRMRAGWTHVIQSGGTWTVDFLNQDYSDNDELSFMSSDLDIFFVPGRTAGTTPQIYTLLYYPQQIDTLMSSTAVTIISFDLMDSDALPGSADHGKLSVNEVIVDSLDRPATNSPTATAVPGLTFSSFAGWTPGTKTLDPTGNNAGTLPVCSAANIQITVAGTNKLFQAYTASPTAGVALDTGRYYRAIFTVTSTQASGNFGPTILAGFGSTRAVTSMVKHLPGGGTWSQIGTTPAPYEVWFNGPSPFAPSTTLSEPFFLRFESYLISNPNLLFNRTIAGTLRCTGVVTQSFPAP